MQECNLLYFNFQNLKFHKRFSLQIIEKIHITLKNFEKIDDFLVRVAFKDIRRGKKISRKVTYAVL